MRRQIKLISALWGCMLGSMLLIGLILQFPLLSHLSSSLTTGLEEMIFIAIALILNRDWLQQPLTYSLTATWRQRLHPLEPTLIVTGLMGGYTLMTAHRLNTTLTILFIAILISLFEETFFRGMLFQASRQTLGVIKAAIFSSLLFSLTHLINLSHQALSLTLLQLVFTFVFGLLLCLITAQTASLFWPLIIHAANDFFSSMQPPINLPGIHSTASFQIVEIIIVVLLMVPILHQNRAWLP